MSKPQPSDLGDRSTSRHMANALERLASVSVQTHIYARKIVPITTIINMMITIGFIIIPATEKIDTLFVVLLLIGVCVIYAISFYNLAHFDGLIRDGDVFYNQLSDELEWISRTGSAKDDPLRQARSSQVKLVMRQFLNESSLPVVRGRLGVLIYLLLDFLFFAVTVLFLRQWILRP